MAAAAGTSGDAFFLASDYLSAQKRYSEACKLDPKEPKYALKLGDAFFQQAKYDACLKTVRVAWQKLKRSALDDYDPLCNEIATLYMNARLYHEIWSKRRHQAVAPLSEAQAKLAAQVTSTIHVFIEEAIAEQKYLDKPLDRTWSYLQTTLAETKTPEEAEGGTVQAMYRLWQLPLFKTAIKANAEFPPKFSHDSIRSIVESLLLSDGNNDATSLGIEIKNGRQVMTGEVAIMYGGFGTDGRNVFTNITNIVETMKQFIRSFKGALSVERKVHVTATDIDPSVVARFMITMVLLEQLQTKKDDPKELDVVHATLLYLHVSLVMPQYCAELVQTIIDDLITRLSQGDASPAAYIHISEASIPLVLDILRFWATIPHDRVTKTLLDKNPIVGQEITHKLPMSTILAKAGVGDTDQRPGSSEPIYNDIDKELLENHRQTRIFYPPPSLLDRHPAVSRFIKCRGTPSKELASAAAEEVETTWFPNPILFGYEEEYPSVTTIPFTTCIHFIGFTRRWKKDILMSPGKTVVSITRNFFTLISDSMAWLSTSRLKVELVVGNAYQILPLLVSGALGSRPSTFPKQFARIGLSTIPDNSQGLLPIATFLAPFLEVHDRAGVLFDYRQTLKTGDKAHGKEDLITYTHHHCHLSPTDIPRFLGCAVHYNKDDYHGSSFRVIPGLLPRALKELATRNELFDWLTSLLFSIISDGKPNEPYSATQTALSLSGFILIVVYLCDVGYPPHYLGDFIQSLADGKITTSILPYGGPLPRRKHFEKSDKPRDVSLAFWKAEIQTVLSLVRDGLPFPFMIPSDFPDNADAGQYWAEFGVISKTLFGTFKTKALQIVFFKPQDGVTPLQLVDAALQSLRENGIVEDDSVQFYTLVESRSFAVFGEFSWVMNDDWYRRMVEEEWCAVIYRNDTHVVMTTPTPSSEWTAAESEADDGEIDGPNSTDTQRDGDSNEQLEV